VTCRSLSRHLEINFGGNQAARKRNALIEAGGWKTVPAEIIAVLGWLTGSLRNIISQSSAAVHAGLTLRRVSASIISNASVLK